MTLVVNIRFEPYDVYIGRAGKGQDGTFGNPFHSGDRDKDITQYKLYFHTRLKQDPEFRHKVHQLKDKRLGCFCKPHRACHGDIIADYLNSLPEIKPIKLAVIGSRHFRNYQFLEDILQWYDISTIISGEARGADTLAADYAIRHKIPLKEYPAEWIKYGRKAGVLRNKLIIDHCDEVVAFMDQKNPTPGTSNAIEMAHSQGKPVAIYWPINNSDDSLLDWV